MRPKPWLAGVFSLFCPGVGQLYCGDIRRFVIVFIVVAVIQQVSVLALILWNQPPFNVIVPLVVVVVVYLVAVWDSVALARRTQEVPVLPWYRRWYACIGVVIALALVVHFGSPVARNYEGFYIPAGSMENALMVGDRVYVDHGAYKSQLPRTNDVVVFRFPLDPSINYVKRCVAGPGDTVEVRDNRLFVNGIREEEVPTVKHSSTEVKERMGTFGPYVVPKDKVFVLGDHREQSYDSRFWGPVPHALLVGKARRIYFSSDFGRIGLSVQ